MPCNLPRKRKHDRWRNCTWTGFCDVAALSRYASGLPFTSWFRMGNSCRRLSPRADSDAGGARSTTCDAHSAIGGL